MLDKAGWTDDNEIIALRDIVDRGPDSSRVLQFFGSRSWVLRPAVPREQQRDGVLIGRLSGENYLTETYHRPRYELYRCQEPFVVGHRDFLATGLPLIYQDHVKSDGMIE